MGIDSIPGVSNSCGALSWIQTTGLDATKEHEGCCSNSCTGSGARGGRGSARSTGGRSMGMAGVGLVEGLAVAEAKEMQSPLRAGSSSSEP